MKKDDINKLVVFNDNSIRRILYDNQWWFVLIDIIAALTNSTNPSDYLKKLRARDRELSKGWGQIVTPLLMETPGGIQKINCSNTEY